MVTAPFCATEREVEAVVAASVGAAVTVMGRFTTALKESPVLEITFAVKLNVDVPTAAAELPVKVNVQFTAPAEVTVGELNAAVKPLGSPETTLIVEPVAPAGNVTPPAGVAAMVTVALEIADTVTVVGALVYFTDGGTTTCSVMLLVAFRPPPVAVRVTTVEATLAADDAVKVSVSAFEVAPATEVIEVGDHTAVTPVGRVLNEKAMLPLKEPPVAAVKLRAPLVPCATLRDVAVPVRVSVGG